MVFGIVSRLWSMSLQAGILILVILAVRFLLKKYPKIYTYSLWMLAGIRLLCPVFVETPFSLQPETVRPEGIWNHSTLEEGNFLYGRPQRDDQEVLPGNSVYSGLPVYDTAPLPAVGNDMGEDGDNSISLKTDAWQQGTVNPVDVLVIIYLAGVGVFFCIYFAQYFVIKCRISTAVRGKQNVWFSENVDSPFVLGIIRPKIIMPYGLKKTEGYHILRHEQTHIRHHDPLIRLLGTLCVCLHWWNPLVWVAVSRMNQDMEMYCDETVLRDAPLEVKKSYAKTLLSFSVKRSGLSVGLAFGESHTERRVRNLTKKRKGGVLMTCLVAILAIFCAAAFMTIPGIEADGVSDAGKNPENSDGNHTIKGQDGIGSGSDDNVSGGIDALSEEDVDYLISICPKIPEFVSEQDLNESYWKDFLFTYYTSDFDRETVDRYVEQYNENIPYIKVKYSEVEKTVEQIFGKPLSYYVESPQTLNNDNVIYEEGAIYISTSDSPSFEYEYLHDTDVDILKEVLLSESLIDDEDYECWLYLYLLPADNERGFILSGKEKVPVPQDTDAGVIEGQTFDLEMNPYGQVTFAAYAPNTPLNPSDDVSFKLIQDGQIICNFDDEVMRQDKENRIFQDVAAVAFPDINNDGYTDIITIVNYKSGETTLSEAHIYTGREEKYFLEEEYLEELYNHSNDRKTISGIINFVKLPESQDYYMRTSIYGRWEVTEHIPPTGIYALSEEEIQSFEGVHMQYERDWYKVLGDSDPNRIEGYHKETITAGEFEEGFMVDIGGMGISVESFQYYEPEGLSGNGALFGQHFYLIDKDNALIYYEGVFFRAVRE